MKLHSDTYDNYKKSEGEWAEAVPSEWQERRVKDLFRMVTQTAPANNDHELLSLYASIGVRPRKDLEARGNKASSTDGYWMVKKNDIVVNKLLAWMGSVGLSEYDGVTSPAYDVLRQVNSEIDPRYYAYLFRTETAKKIFRKNSRGIMDMRLRLYFDKLGAITIPVPPYDVQIAIADYIDTKASQIDKKVEILTRKASLYESLKKSIVYEVVTQGIDNTVPLKESGIDWVDEIPSHWEVKRVKEVLGSLDYKRIPLSGEVRGKMKSRVYDYYGASGVIDKVEDYIFDEPTILIGEDGANLLSRSTPLAYIARGQYWVNNHAHILKPHKGNIDFFCYLLESLDYTTLITGAAQPKFTAGQLNHVLLMVPPLEEQKYIADYLNEKCTTIDSVIKNIKRQIENFRGLRVAMINDAVTGRIKVIDDSRAEE